MVALTAIRISIVTIGTAAFFSQLASAAPILTDFNLVVGGNVASSSEVEGRTLVGGHLSGSASNYGVGLNPSSNFSDVATLIVGGNITATNVNVNAGDVRVGGGASGNVNLNGVGSDLLQNDASLTGVVASIVGQLQSLSAYLAGLVPNSVVANPPGPSAVTFHPTAGPDRVAVFNVDAAMFSDPNSQQFDLAWDEPIELMVINVYGASIDFSRVISSAASAIPQLDRTWCGTSWKPTR